MFRQYFDRLIGWFSTSRDDDERQRKKHAQQDGCEHGGDASCPYERQNFDCNDCEIDEATGKMRPRI